MVQALQEASGFDIYRLLAAMGRTLLQRRRQCVACRHCVELRRKRVLVLDQSGARRWLIDYAAINLVGVDVAIREQPARGLGRHEVAVGDTVGSQGRAGRQRARQVIRPNDKTVTLRCDGQNWRVGYGLLHRLVDSNSCEWSMAARL